MRIDIGDTGAEQALKIKNSTDALLSRLQEHHDYDVHYRDIPKPQVIEIHAEPEECLPIEICILPIPQGKITVDGIKRVVCKYFGISHTDIVSPRRDLKVLRPRVVAITLSKEMTTHSLSEIGRRFGRRDHTTVLASLRKMERLIAANDPLAQDVSYLRGVLSA